jgi:hypothetical protein
VKEPPFQAPPVAEPSRANGADEVVIVEVEEELVDELEVVEEEVLEAVVDDEVDDDVEPDVAVDVVVVGGAVLASTASTIMAPKLALFVQPTVAEVSKEETTSYSAPKTWG